MGAGGQSTTQNGWKPGGTTVYTTVRLKVCTLGAQRTSSQESLLACICQGCVPTHSVRLELKPVQESPGSLGKAHTQNPHLDALGTFYPVLPQAVSREPQHPP